MMKIAQKCNLQLLPLPGGPCAGAAAGLAGLLSELQTSPGVVWSPCWGCFASSPHSSLSAPDKQCSAACLEQPLVPSVKEMFWLFELFWELKGLVWGPRLMSEMQF